MIFAFLWVIIGDLVSMHIRAICDNDIQQEQPFSKTQKSDKKSYKVDGKKINKVSKSTNSDLFFSESVQATFLKNTKDFLYWFIPKLIADNNKQNHQGRAPPC